VPLTDFDGEPLWIEPPTKAEVQERLETFHGPYHQALRKEIDRVHSLHGCVILFDCHSIRSEIPFLFEGTLPDFNVGTNDGKTCAAIIEREVVDQCQQAVDFKTVVNGRFKGGWTTREYGQPKLHRHAIQMELAQKNYLVSESPPFDYDVTKANRFRAVLQSVLLRLEELVEQRVIPSQR
jgi:formiminoglutamase